MAQNIPLRAAQNRATGPIRPNPRNPNAEQSQPFVTIGGPRTNLMLYKYVESGLRTLIQPHSLSFSQPDIRAAATQGPAPPPSGPLAPQPRAARGVACMRSSRSPATAWVLWPPLLLTRGGARPTRRAVGPAGPATARAPRLALGCCGRRPRAASSAGPAPCVARRLRGRLRARSCGSGRPPRRLHARELRARVGRVERQRRAWPPPYCAVWSGPRPRAPAAA